MRGRYRTGDHEGPHKVVHTVATVVLSPADVMQRGRRVKAHRRPHPVGHQSVEGRAFVHLVKVRQRPPRVQLLARSGIVDRRPFDVVEQPFRQVGSGNHVLEALLVLDADGVAAEVMGDPHRGDVHLALLQNLGVGQIGLLVRPGHEGHAPRVQPVADSLRLRTGDQPHGRHQRRLAQPLLVHAGRVEQFIIDDAVVHAHAALIEDAQDGLVMGDLAGQSAAQRRLRRWQAGGIESAHMAEVVVNLALA